MTATSGGSTRARANLQLPWLKSTGKAELPWKAIQSRKQASCSLFSTQGGLGQSQSSSFCIIPSLLFLTYFFVGLNVAQHGSWPGQLLTNEYKKLHLGGTIAGNAVVQLYGLVWLWAKEPKSGSKEWQLYLYISFRCKQQLLYAKPSVHKALILLMELLRNYQTLVMCRCCLFL